MTVIDLGKNLSQYGVEISDVSPKQLLAEVMEAIREKIGPMHREYTAILVNERMYRSLVDQVSDWTRDGELIPYRPDLCFLGLKVYVWRDEQERTELKWQLIQERQRVLEVVE